MKRKWLALVGAAVILLAVVVTGCSSGGGGGVTLSGDTGLKISAQQDGIWVNGSGKVYAAPDVAVLNLGIESQEATVAEARDKAAEAMQKVMDALKSEGVAEEDIQTQRFNIQHIKDWELKYFDEDEGAREEVVLGYRVTNMVIAKVRDIETVDTIIDAVALAGGDLTRIDNIGFTVDDPSPYYEEARAQAIEYAKAKAKQLAELGGVKLGAPTYITENSYMPSSNYISRDMVAEAGAIAPSATTSISAGEMEITANVQIAYAIQ
jgi:uncharacterized protein YggE